MRISQAEIFNDVIIIEPDVFEDNRGEFMETFNLKWLKSYGLPEFVQDNQSVSHKNVLRGLHFQRPPFTQGKLVRVVSGAVNDVVVDCRKSSPTFGRHFKIHLSDQNRRIMYVPEGFAHGFLSLKNDTVFSYKCTNFYHGPSESGILWNDPFLNIDWEINQPVVSEKDTMLLTWEKQEFPF